MSLNLNGGRYVFFKSIGNTENPEIKLMYNNASARLASISSVLSGKSEYEEKSETHLTNIEKYLNFIRSMIDSLKANEMDFLKNEISQLPQNHELRILLTQLTNSSEIKYDDIMNAFNTLMQDKDTYTASLEIQRHNMEILQHNMEAIKNKDSALYKKIQDEYETNYRNYIHSLMSGSYRFNAAETKTYKTSLTRQLATRANQVLKTIDGNPQILAAIQESVVSEKGGNVSTDTIKNIIINTIIDEVVNTPLDIDCSAMADKIAKKLIDSTKTTLNDMRDVEFSRIISKDFKELEELALTTNNSLGEHILTLDKQSINNIKKNYPEVADIVTELYGAKKKKLSDSEIGSLQNRVTRKLRASILKRAQDALHDPNLTAMTKGEFTNKFKNVTNFITTTSLRGGLEEALRGLKITHDSIGEILASNDVRRRIVDAVVNNIPGISISFKADIRFATGAINPDSFNDFEINDIINQVITDNYSNFLLKYKDKSGGQTDVALAMEAYKEQVADMKAEIDHLIDLNNQITDKVAAKNKAYEDLYKTFSVSISVKDYDLYNNVLGFHGGSLGGKKSPEQVLNNIYKMYELGGITELDVETLLFAVMNCGDAMIGSGLRPALENYLVGGAALIMFDDSFAASEDFLKQLTDSFKGQKIVNIYRLNTKYVPASYVLEGIYSDLTKIYSDLQVESSLDDITAHSHVTIINPVTEAADPKTGTLEDRFNAVSSITQSSISIQFSFMGGLLDTLNSIPSAFNQ